MDAPSPVSEISLDPSTLPPADIIALAQSGLLCRAERDTPDGGVPAFMTKVDWDTISVRFSVETPSPNDLIAAVERAVHHLLGHAAERLTKCPAGEVSAVLNVKTDLFAENGETFLSFVRDRTHPVACVIVGTHPWNVMKSMYAF